MTTAPDAAPPPALDVEHAGRALDLPNTRETYRVRIPVTLRLPPVRIFNQGGDIKGTLVDLSRVGAAVLAPLDTPLGRGNQIGCDIDLPKAQLHLVAEVRSSVSLKQHQRLGLRFIGMTTEQRRVIETTTALLERSMLRHLHATQKPPLRA